MTTVLLVDDSRAVRLIGRRIVEGLGCDALEACNGQEALDVMHDRQPVDAIILDWNMPVMDGLKFLQTLRAEPRPQPVVVMCTTENDLRHITQALSAGANEYIMKPFTDDIVRDKLLATGVL